METPVSAFSHQSVELDEAQEIHSKLTQIHNTLKDLNRQQEIWIMNSNDSLLDSLNEAKQSIVDNFSVEFNSLKQIIRQESPRTDQDQLVDSDQTHPTSLLTSSFVSEIITRKLLFHTVKGAYDRYWSITLLLPFLFFLLLLFHNPFMNDKFHLALQSGVGIDVETQFDKKGDAQAYYLLAQCFFYGDGESKNLTTAVELYTLAAIQGHAQAQYYLAMFYLYGSVVIKNQTKAIELLTFASEQGNDEAQNTLALCYLNGDVVTKNLTKAVILYTLAANQGHVEAQYNLARCYEYGIGVSKNDTKAAELFSFAAAHGDP
jgi:TPR repeat protein